MQIPPPPAYLQPVGVAKPRKGESILAVAEREQSGRRKANTIIGAARRDWACMQAELAGGKCEDEPK